jgi:hypothetical protein
MKAFVLAIALGAGMLALYFGLHQRDDSIPSAEQGRVTVRAVQRLPVERGAAAVPGARLAPPKSLAGAKAARVSPLMAEMSRARSYKAIYDRLSAKTDRTPEETYALAEILVRCGKGINPLGFQYRQRLGGEDRRRQFVDALPPNDPQRDRRIAAFDEVNHDFCAGLEGLDVKQADVRSLIASAAAAGDPRARVTQVTYEIWERPQQSKGVPGPLTITDGQLDTLRSVLGSDDPEAVLAATRALYIPFVNLTLRTGPEQATLDWSAFNQAAHFMACDLGMACGRDAPELAYACAVHGHCGAADYREYAYLYMVTANTAQAIQQYYEQLYRARAGDWSYFTFHRGPSPRTAMQARPR